MPPATDPPTSPAGECRSFLEDLAKALGVTLELEILHVGDQVLHKLPNPGLTARATLWRRPSPAGFPGLLPDLRDDGNLDENVVQLRANGGSGGVGRTENGSID